MSYNLKLYDVTQQGFANSTARAVIDIISIVAICRSVVQVAGERGKEKAMLYAFILTTVAYIIPRLVLRSILDKLCKECPGSGAMSMAIVTILVLVVLEQTIRYVLLKQ